MLYSSMHHKNLLTNKIYLWSTNDFGSPSWRFWDNDFCAGWRHFCSWQFWNRLTKFVVQSENLIKNMKVYNIIEKNGSK